MGLILPMLSFLIRRKFNIEMSEVASAPNFLKVKKLEKLVYQKIYDLDRY
jgi:hypothetical protein